MCRAAQDLNRRSPRARSGRALRERRLRAGVAPELSPSGPVRDQEGPWALATCRTYSRSQLLSLAPAATIWPASWPAAVSASSPPPAVTGIRGFLINTRSLVSNHLAMFSLLSIWHPDIVCITESWLTPTSSPVIAQALPTEYAILHVDRASSHPAGGVALIFKKSLSCTLLPLTFDCNMEAMLVRLSFSQSTFLHLLIVYRPPPSDSSFTSGFASLLSVLSLQYSNLLVYGDFNFWPDDLSHSPSVKFIQALNDINFIQRVSGPTHVKGHTLDLIFSNPADLEVTVFPPLPTLWSDHYLVPFSFPFLSRPLKPTRRFSSRRHWNKVAIEDLALAVSENFHLLESRSPATLLDNFQSSLTHAADLLAPATSKPCPDRSSSPWFTIELHALKSEVRHAERIWRSSYAPEFRTAYKTLSCSYHKLIVHCKKEYYKDLIENAVNSPRALFKVVQDLSTPPPSRPLATRELCDSLAKFFISKIDAIRANIPRPSRSPENLLGPCSLKPTSKGSLDSFTAATPDTILQATNRLKSASPLDPVPLTMLKSVMPFLASSLTLAVNQSFTLGVIPASIKQALVIPLLKKPSLDPADPQNFRPISLLPFLMKLLEVLVTPQLRTFLESSHILDPFQSGFRPAMGTESVVVSVLDDLARIRDQGGVGVLILLDLSAAFDTIDHPTLINRLRDAGVSGPALAWFSSFLSSRSQSVSLPPFQSAPSPISCGVPQGSALSPLLFNLYIQPLARLIHSHGFRFYSYADDTQLLLRLDLEQERVAPRLCGCLEAVGEWMNQNWLKLNGGKTEVLVVGPPTASALWSPSFWPSSLGSFPTPVKTVKDLGVKITSDLSRDAHAGSTCSSVHFKLRLLKKVLPFIPHCFWAPVVSSMTHGSLDYCNAIYLAQPAYILHRLQVAQNAAVRLVTGIKRLSPVSAHRRSLHWLPIECRVQFKSLCIIHHAIYGSCAPYLTEKLIPYTPLRSLRSASKALLKVPPSVSVKFGDRAFSTAGPRLWNSLPFALRSERNFIKFKASLKTLLFS